MKLAIGIYSELPDASSASEERTRARLCVALVRQRCDMRRTAQTSAKHVELVCARARVHVIMR